MFVVKEQQNNEVTSDQAFVVNPGQTRSIRNPNRSPLVMLRCCDGGKTYDEGGKHLCGVTRTRCVSSECIAAVAQYIY